MAAEVFAMVTAGMLKPAIGRRFPLAEVAEAHRALEARLTTGATILTL
jgi:NADPH2:quinone reductase